MADAIDEMDPKAPAPEGVMRLGGGDCWAVHQQDGKFRFDIWNGKGDPGRCVPMHIEHPKEFPEEFMFAVTRLSEDALRDPSLAHGLNGMRQRALHFQAKYG